MEDIIKVKQKEYNDAMKFYEERQIYQVFSRCIAIVNVSVQVILTFIVLPTKIGIGWQLFSLILAYLMADFINGLVHMYMDNNDYYKSIAGPLVASFHLHHKKPLYKKNKIIVVYFNESGSKIWLAALSILAIIVISIFDINPVILHIILYFSIFSCIAEVSHYLCHVSDGKFVGAFRKSGLILGKHHHGRHHLEDNVNYAFLNGVSDPLINIIAKKFYPGYKNTTDRHYENYQGKGTKNR